MNLSIEHCVVGNNLKATVLVHCPPNKREAKLSIKQCKWPVLVHCLPNKKRNKVVYQAFCGCKHLKATVLVHCFPKKKNWNLLGFILDKVFTSFPTVVKTQQHCKYKPVRSQELYT